MKKTCKAVVTSKLGGGGGQRIQSVKTPDGVLYLFPKGCAKDGDFVEVTYFDDDLFACDLIRVVTSAA